VPQFVITNQQRRTKLPRTKVLQDGVVKRAFAVHGSLSKNIVFFGGFTTPSWRTLVLNSSVRRGRDPTYGPDVKLWHGAAPFSLVFKGEGLGMRVSNQIVQSLGKGVYPRLNSSACVRAKMLRFKLLGFASLKKIVGLTQVTNQPTAKIPNISY